MEKLWTWSKEALAFAIKLYGNWDLIVSPANNVFIYFNLWTWDINLFSLSIIKHDQVTYIFNQQSIAIKNLNEKWKPNKWKI